MQKSLIKNGAFFLLFGLFLISSCSDDEGNGEENDLSYQASNTNVLLVIADDVGLDPFPLYDLGAQKAQMPNIEALAARGIKYNNAWAYPICSPTRASILTGKYGYHTGVLDANTYSQVGEDELSLQQFLTDHTANDYAHSIIGKWHLSGNKTRQAENMGIGYWAGILSGGVSDYFSWSFTEDGETSIREDYCTEAITDLAIDWINEQEKPWFCWVAYNAAHTPFHLPPDYMHTQGELPDDTESVDANPLPYYLAMVESLDYEFGRLWDNIPADERDNTLVIFIGDNGTPRPVSQAPYEEDQTKGSLYQGGLNVPLVVAGKGVSRMGAVENGLVHSIDLFATVAAATGINVSSYENSKDFSPSFSAANSIERDHAYSEVMGMSDNKTGYAIRNERYKHLRFNSGLELFFDLENDPFEKVNLLAGTLTDEEQEAFQSLEELAAEIRQ